MIPSILDPGEPRPRPLGNEVCVVERMDLWSKFRDPIIRRGTITTDGIKELMGTDMQLDRVAIVEVTGAGPGIYVQEVFKENCIKVGHIGLINGMMVGRCITMHQRQHWGISNHKVFAVLENWDQSLPTPTMGQVFTRPNQKWMQYVYTGRYDIPIAFDEDGTVEAGNGVDPRRVAYEEVIAVADDVKDVPLGCLVSIPKDHGCDTFIYRGRGFNVCGKNKIGAILALAEEKPDDLERVIV